MQDMFVNCISLSTLDLSSFHTANVTQMQYMFSGCYNLTTIYVGDGWNVDKVVDKVIDDDQNTINENTNYMFSGCQKLVGGRGTMHSAQHINKEYAHIDGGVSNPGYFTKTPVTLRASTDFTDTFADATDILFGYTKDYEAEVAGLAGTDVSIEQNGGAMLYKTADGKVYVLSDGKMYANPTCEEMFFKIASLQSITFENFDTSRITNAKRMFYDCPGITNLDVSGFDTSKITTMSEMFVGLGVTSLDLTNFDTSSCENMKWMFSRSTKLQSVDLSSFDTSNVTVTAQMFDQCKSITTVYVGDGWNTDQVTNSEFMFRNCPNIVGGQGTLFDAEHITKEYAHVDGGESDPGYFTDIKDKPAAS